MTNGTKIFLTVIGVGLILAVNASTAVGQPFGISSPEPQKAYQRLLCSEGGRFVFGQISDSSKDQFMLDTLSGRLWRITESGKVGIYLKTVPYLNGEGEYTSVPEREVGPAKETGKKEK